MHIPFDLPPSGAWAEGVVFRPDLDPPLRLDIAFHPLAAQPTPLVISLFAGGYRTGDRRQGTPVWDLFADGFAVAAIDYRLSDRAQFPSQPQDAQAAIRALRAWAPRFNLDPARVGLFGASAGGHLAALLGCVGDRDPWPRLGQFTDQRQSVQAVCSWCPPVDLLALDPEDDPDASMARLLGAPPRRVPELARLADPRTHAASDTAPLLLMHGTADTIVEVDHSRKLAGSLRAAGGQCELMELEGIEHDLHWYDAHPEFRITVRDFLRERLRA